MRSPALRTLAAALLLTLAACVAHDKAADKAAAVGDWKNAYLEYRQALAEDEANPQLKARFEEARQKALAQATGQARACAAQAQWACAFNEADFALSIDPSSVELGTLRTDAARRLALGTVQRADAETARGNLQAAQGLLVEARRLSADRAVDEAARAAERRWTGAAAGQAEELRASRRYGEALALLQVAVGYDPSLRPRLDQVNREYQAYREAEFARQSALGDQALAQGGWAEAAARFKAAQAIRPDERARARERYAMLVLRGDQAVARADYPGAAEAYREAADLAVERGGYAEAHLARVAVRPWTVTVRGVLVDPVRPDGTPWVGPPSVRLNRVARELAGREVGRIDGKVLRAVNDVPRDNRPALFVEVVLPDGQRLASAVLDGPYLALDASFVVAANGFDVRRLLFRVLHQEPGRAPERIGEVAVPVGDLLGRPESLLATPPVLALELRVAPADGAPAGRGRGFTPVAEPGRPPPPAPPPRR